MSNRKNGSSARVIGLAAGLACSLALTATAGDPPAHHAPALPPHIPAGKEAAKPNLADHALRALQEGNERFVAGKPIHPNSDVFRITDTGADGQHPFAAVITCADSRVAVERLFDRGVGDLFVVRVAGNICDPNECGSVEYACAHLGTQLVLVMGHTKCGAVKAAIGGGGGGDAGPNINSLLDNIAPVVQSVKAAHPDLAPDDMLDACVHENVWKSIADLYTNSQAIREMVSRGSVKVVGAVYDVQSGRVEWMGQHPMQSALLKSSDTPAAAPSAMEKSATPTHDKPTAAGVPDKAKGDKPIADKSGFVKPAPAPGTTTAKKPEVREEGKQPPAHAAHPH